MRGHKFLCLIDPNYFHEHAFTEAENKQVSWNDEEFMTVLTLAHEKFSDNLVTLVNESDPNDDYEYVRTMDGKLYHISDFWDKNEVIRRFEQTD